MYNRGLEKEIDYLRDAKAQVWALTLGTFGGTFGLAFTTLSILMKIILMIIGFSLFILFLDNYFQKGDKIEKMIKILRKKDE